MNQTLITSKFFLPPPRPGQVMRERLQQRFLQGLSGRLTLVSAPAGFGKTTLVSASIHHSGRNAVWISLDEGDGTLQRFITLLTTGIRRAVTGFGGTVTSLLEASQPPAEDVLLATLLNDLAALETPLALVLDDYHAIDAAAVDEALAFLLEHLPPNLRLVILTREDPSLPLARLRARGELVELRAVDLRFTADEATVFLNQTMGLALDAQQISALEERTEGWIAGLQLAALSLQSRDDSSGFIREFTGSHRFVIDYLAEEVLARQPTATRDFLLQTAVLDRFNAQLCDAVTQTGDGESLLSLLDRQNLFLVPLDEQRQWYRYHHLFRDVLRTRLRQSRFASDSLHRRASRWLEQHDFMPEAIQHALQAGDTSDAARIIETLWPELRKHEPEATFIAWMQALPPECIERSPILSAHYGLCLLSLDLDQGERWLQAAEAALEASPAPAGDAASHSSPHTALPGLLAVARAYQAGALGDLPGIVGHANRALDLLDESEAIWRGSAAVLLGLVHWGSGDLEAAVEAISLGYESMKLGEEISGAISTTYLLANLRIAQGRRQEAERLCQKALSLAGSRAAAPQGTADILVTLAALALGRNRLDEAGDLLQRAQSLGEHARLKESAHHWCLLQSQLEAAQGRFANARDLLEEARAVQNPSPVPDFAPIDAWQARYDILSGDLDTATRWAQANGLSASDASSPAQVFSHLTLAHLLVARHRHDPASQSAQQAENLLLRLRDEADARHHHGNLVEIDLLLALSQQLTGNEDSARDALRNALTIPEAEQQAFRFVSLDDASTDWIRKTLADLDTPAWARALVTPPTPITSPKQAAETPPLVEPLSDRELDVLRMLHGELSGPEIAASLFVSLNTLRTHTKNIYSKLGVNNRRAAVRRAGELGLA